MTSKKARMIGLSLLVIFTVTLSLILPAFTLDSEEAKEQGGIDVPAVEAVETQEEQDLAEGEAQEEPAPVEESSEDAKESAEESEPLVLASEKKNYDVSVTCGQESGIPEDAELKVREIRQGKEAVDGATEYEKYLAKTQEALGEDSSMFQYARFFDISIVKDRKEVQPADGSTVDVKIALDDVGNGDLSVVHFGDEPEVVDAEVKDDEVTFEASGFSVYAIVKAPEYVPETRWDLASSLQDIEKYKNDGFLMKNPGGYYFTNETYSVNTSRTGIRKTKPAISSPAVAEEKAAKYYFVSAGDKYKVYCKDENGDPLFIKQSGNSLSFTDEAGATAFTFSSFPDQDNTFRAEGTRGYYMNMQGGNNGNGFAAYNSVTDTNNRIQLEYKNVQENDPYDLNGKTYGIGYYDGGSTSALMMNEAMSIDGKQRLTSVKTSIKPDVLDNDGVMLVTDDISEWTFESIYENKYYITTKVNGQKKYLTIDGANVTLQDEPGDKSVITVNAGEDSNAGKWHFTMGNYSLSLPQGVAKGFGASTGSAAATWLNLVEKTDLKDEDFVTYTARKVSVSDRVQVHNGQQVIVYTRVWNEDTKRYEFFAVDHDGSLIPCTDCGDTIKWIGSDVNTALWDFTEYTGDDGTPNHYYELQNVQYGNCIAPQLSGDQTMSDDTFGINLDGRRKGKTSSTIIAWDDENYHYAGLKTEDGHIVPCRLSEAEDFYFAVIKPVEPVDPENPNELSTVETVDSAKYGITMKMIDFNNTIVDGRDSVQTSFFGQKPWNSAHAYEAETGLVSTNLENDGYPKVTAETGMNGDSLAELFNNMTPANHLFIQSVYNESGYFEYDSTQNFAHLNDDGNFTVYNHLGAIGTTVSPTRAHGQFMPFNDISAKTGYAHDTHGNVITNQYNVKGQELPDTDPRKGEPLYSIPQNTADYYYGMELSAEFTQTPDGVDDWGHDIIFEFTGDDDFWFYVDGELVLDLGGVHSAIGGTVNFRTGEVNCNGTKTTLYDIFKSNYSARGKNPDDVDALFVTKTVNGETVHVFNEYTKHEMKMFYMERGAGASNLHMRFNLAAVKPGTFLLSKKLSGTEDPSNDLIEFPYQIWYKRTVDSEYQLLTNKVVNSESEGEIDSVVYEDTTTPVPYKGSFTLPESMGSKTYEHVFFLKPGQTAEVRLPENTADYYVVECAVDPGVYKRVTQNGTELVGQRSAHTHHCEDYKTSEATTLERQKVDFDNEVKEGAMRTLSITKQLYDSDGETRLHYPDNKTGFNFRLYLGNEYADASNLPGANLYPYYVKDASGNYCKYNAADKTFEPIGKTEYSQLTKEDKEEVTFYTSMHGAITKIPPDHTVEVRGLIAGTRFKVEERESEIPKGYTLRLEDGYQEKKNGNHFVNRGTDPVSYVVAANHDPQVRVNNQKGWGLTVNKVWTDRDFMASHDDVYFAVYRKGTGDQLGAMLDGTVRRLKAPDTSLYYFFGNLQSGTPFANYVVREVTLTGDGITVDQEGVVTRYDSVVPIESGGSLTIGGTPVGGAYHPANDGYTYSVSYQPGEQTTQNENVRTDTVTNSRPGIKLYKIDWNGAPLAGAVFTLKGTDGTDVAAPTYTSGEDGLITIAYLNPGTYTLAETKTPKGYVGSGTMNITIGDDYSVSVSGMQESLYSVKNNEDGMTAVIRIKNRSASFIAKKIDGDTGAPIEGVHFALYRQVTDNSGKPMKDHQPIAGYEDLVTGADGVLPEITQDLASGTYYLVETEAAGEYNPMTEDLCFTMREDRTVAVNTDAYKTWLSNTTNWETGQTTYTLNIKNGKMKRVEIKKINAADASDTLQGAEFKLYAAADFDDNGHLKDGALPLAGGVTGEDGQLDLGMICIGNYCLVETRAPAGFNGLDAPVTISVTGDGVTAIQSGNNSDAKNVGTEIVPIWQITVWNNPGVELPSAGGPGTRWIYLAGTILLLGCGILLAARRVARSREM